MLLVGIHACKSGSDPAPGGGNATTTNLVGTVTDKDSKPVAGVKITVGTLTTTTDANGLFNVDNAPLTNGRCLVKAEKELFYTAVRGLKAGATSSATSITLVSLGTPGKVPAATGGTIVTNGLKIAFPASGFTKNGAAVTGNVDAYVNYISPTDPNLGNLMPGGDLAGLSTSGISQQLITYGAVQVILQAGGQPVDLATGKTAAITFPAGASTLPVIPLWSLNETTGIWKEEGSATLANGVYTGTVTHFSSWNLDLGRDEAELTGTILGCTNQTVGFQKLRIGQRTAYTDANGGFNVAVPAGQDIVIEAANANTYTTLTNIPALTAGATKDAGRLAVCLPSVTGKLVGCNNAAGIADIQLFNNSGQLVAASQPSSNGSFTVSGGAGQQAELRITKINGEVVIKKVTFPALGAQPVDVGSIDVCVSGQPQGRQEMAFTLNGDGRVNQRFLFYSDPIFNDIPQLFKDSGSNTLNLFLFRVNANAATTGSTGITFEIPGTKPGTYTTMVSENQQIIFPGTTGSNAITYLSTDSTLMTFTIAQYDSVGGRVKGTFSGNLGKFMTATNTLIEKPVVTVSAGAFDLVRSADQ